MLGRCLYLLIAFMGSVISIALSIIYKFSFIFRLLVAFLKNLFSFSDTKSSSDTIFSSVRTILFLIFLFSESKGYIVFLKLLSSDTFFWIYFVKICFELLFELLFVSSNLSHSCALKSPVAQICHMSSMYLRFYQYCQKIINHSEKQYDKFHWKTNQPFENLFQERFLQYLPSNYVLLGF